MAGICPQIFVRRTAHNRRAVRGHWTQAGPERRLLNETAAREEIADDHLQRFTTWFEQFGIEAHDFRHAADADPVIETGDGDFVGFIKNG